MSILTDEQKELLRTVSQFSEDLARRLLEDEKLMNDVSSTLNGQQNPSPDMIIDALPEDLRKQEMERKDSQEQTQSSTLGGTLGSHARDLAQSSREYLGTNNPLGSTMLNTAGLDSAIERAAKALSDRGESAPENAAIDNAQEAKQNEGGAIDNPSEIKKEAESRMNAGNNEESKDEEAQSSIQPPRPR